MLWISEHFDPYYYNIYFKKYYWIYQYNSFAEISQKIGKFPQKVIMVT